MQYVWEKVRPFERKGSRIFAVRGGFLQFESDDGLEEGTQLSNGNITSWKPDRVPVTRTFRDPLRLGESRGRGGHRGARFCRNPTDDSWLLAEANEETNEIACSSYVPDGKGDYDLQLRGSWPLDIAFVQQFARSHTKVLCGKGGRCWIVWKDKIAVLDCGRWKLINHGVPINHAGPCDVFECEDELHFACCKFSVSLGGNSRTFNAPNYAGSTISGVGIIPNGLFINQRFTYPTVFILWRDDTTGDLQQVNLGVFVADAKPFASKLDNGKTFIALIGESNSHIGFEVTTRNLHDGEVSIQFDWRVKLEKTPLPFNPGTRAISCNSDGTHLLVGPNPWNRAKKIPCLWRLRPSNLTEMCGLKIQQTRGILGDLSPFVAELMGCVDAKTREVVGRTRGKRLIRQKRIESLRLHNDHCEPLCFDFDATYWENMWKYGDFTGDGCWDMQYSFNLGQIPEPLIRDFQLRYDFSFVVANSNRRRQTPVRADYLLDLERSHPTKFISSVIPISWAADCRGGSITTGKNWGKCNLVVTVSITSKPTNFQDMQYLGVVVRRREVTDP